MFRYSCYIDESVIEYSLPNVMNQFSIIRGKIYRDNLFISVQSRQGNGHQQLLDFLKNHTNEQGIIYTQPYHFGEITLQI
jgi:superfamily II DNA helicase RecQ